MTRKRFIKLLMSKGFSRNRANIAANAIHKGTSYETFYSYIQLKMPVYTYGLKIREAAEVFMQLGNVIAETTTILDSFSAAICGALSACPYSELSKMK